MLKKIPILTTVFILFLGLMLSGCNQKVTAQKQVDKQTQTNNEAIATDTDSSWSPVGGIPWSEVSGPGGFTGTNVYSLCSLNGTLYAGTDGGVWSWNGSTWSQVGGSKGLKGNVANVYSICAIKDTLYAGTWDGGVWSWNGSTWSQVGGSGYRLGNSEITSSLATVNSILYTGTPYGVWSWNGSSWSQIHGSWPSGGLTGSSVNGPQLANINGTLYAGTYGNGVWLRNGSTWSQVGGSGSLSDGASCVDSLTMADEKLYAGTGNGVWSWNGSAWSRVSGVGGLHADTVADTVYVQSFDDMLYATASNGVWLWNGSSWSQVGNWRFTEDAKYIRCLYKVNGILYAGTADGVFSIPISKTQPAS